jgi:zinc/manganese transport system substrate-binding protein
MDEGELMTAKPMQDDLLVPIANAGPSGSRNRPKRWLGAAVALTIGAGIWPLEAQANLKVFACVPEWASLAKQIGGDKVEVTVASAGTDDPDSLRTTPNLIAALTQADLLICTGQDVSEGIEGMVERSGNAKIAAGQPGSFMATEQVKMIGGEGEASAATTDTSQHRHEGGNPHIQGDPHNILTVATQLAKRMIALDPAEVAAYTQNTRAFVTKFSKLTKDLEAEAEPLKGINIVVSSEDDFAYLLRWLGINQAAALEPEMGVAPGPERLAQIIASAPSKGVKFVVYAAYTDPGSAKFVGDHGHLPVLKLPFTVGGTEGATDIFTYYQDTVARLLNGLKGQSQS